MLAKTYQVPIALVQGAWVVLKTERLGEADGPRSGTAGAGAPCRLMVVGDSSAAGVGAKTQDEALAGALVRHLAPHLEVHWRIIAKSGATAATVTGMLEAADAQMADVAVIACGINDAKNGVPRGAWQRNYATLIDTLQNRFSVSLVVISGLPAVEKFPLLPNPLRQIMADRTKLFDGDLQTLARKRAGVMYLSMDFANDPGQMASDQFHPGPQIYHSWGAKAAEMIHAGFVAK